MRINDLQFGAKRLAELRGTVDRPADLLRRLIVLAILAHRVLPNASPTLPDLPI